MNALIDALTAGRFVDLTQPLGPETVLWPGSAPFEATVEQTHEAEGYYSRSLRLSEHSGTHLDAPGHFGRGRETVDQLDLKSLIRPLVCLDVRERVAEEADYAVSWSDLEHFEARHGEIPAGCAFLVCTGWDRFRADADRYLGPAGRDLSFPGLGGDAAKYLVSRGVAGLGIDTLGVDPGNSRDYATHYTTQPNGMWHLEGLVNLDKLPARGAVLVAAVIKVVDGSGAPARAFAVLP